MQIRIGETLRRLRLEKGLTQEKAAEVFGVSPQANSRWENNSTYPDVTMLPGIANFYRISIDELLGMEELRQAEAIHRIFADVHHFEANGMMNEAIQRLRAAIKVYPHHDGFLSELALALTLQANTESGREGIEEAIALSERVLSNSANDKLRSTTKANLCFLYRQAGDREKALKLARTLPHVWESRELLLPDLVPEADSQAELRKGIVTVLSVLCEKIEKTNTAAERRGLEPLMAVGPNLVPEEELPEKLKQLAEFLEAASSE